LRPQVLPAGRFRHPEDIDFAIVVPVFQLADQPGGISVLNIVIITWVGKASGQLCPAGLEGVGDEFKEDQAQHNMLVFGSVHVGAQLVSGGPEGFLDVFDHGVVVPCFGESQLFGKKTATLHTSRWLQVLPDKIIRFYQYFSRT